MNMIGKSVEHTKFGKGQVIGLYENKIEVDFGSLRKKFLYPESFEYYFTISDKTAEDYIKQKLEQIEQEKKEEQHRKEIELYRRTLKNKANSQVVFDLKEDELLQVFTTWQVSTGSYVRAENKGKVRIPQNMNMNSACILTTKQKGKKESERTIAGIFMVKDDFIGAQCETGIIVAHEKYRATCEIMEDELKFWDYFSEDKKLKSWGSVKMKYVSDAIIRRILQDMIRTTMDEGCLQELQEFYEYFCEMNHLQDFN